MINRKALFTRNAPHYEKPEPSAPLSVGNGQFCFTADVTGLQSLAEEYTICPLCTMAEWGWHRYPDAPADDRALRLTPYDTFGREVGYATDHEGQEDLFYALRQSAHKASLVQVGLLLDGRRLTLADIGNVNQTLQLWEGVLYSAFTVEDAPVRVTTFAHPQQDTLCVQVESPLLTNGRLSAFATFPYGSHKISGADFSVPHKHKTLLVQEGERRMLLSRHMDDLCSTVEASVAGGTLSFDDAHTLALHAGGDTMAFSLRFALPQDAGKAAPAESFAENLAACQTYWQQYWAQGGAIELAGSTDPRAAELERRIVLSQYIVAIQSRGNLPPAETGLTINSWYGKFNVEMHCWHHAHFALWNRPEVIRKSLTWYQKTLPVAKEIARTQGYTGARWPKLCDGSGYNSPSSIAVLLIWQQPHPIMLAELCRRLNPTAEILREYRDIIVETAEFMVSFAHFDGTRYVLGAPYIPSQERFDPRTVLNAGFEVEYFRWGLRTAVRWLELLGEVPSPQYTEVADKLAVPVTYGGVYPAHENCPETYTTAPFNTDHPSMVAMLGLLAGECVSREAMSATLDKILVEWDLPSAWGWDFPMLAMTAARLGRTHDAIDLLLMDSPKNEYLLNGHNRQGTKEDLPLYLPGNGSLLLAIGMMASGWDGAPSEANPGFPQDGSFTVTAEGLNSYI